MAGEVGSGFVEEVGLETCRLWIGPDERGGQAKP